MRITFATLLFASGSDVPRPTTMSMVSWSETPSPAASRASLIRSPEASSSFSSMPRSRAYRISISGCCVSKVFSTEGMSFLTWPAANSIPGIARHSSFPRARSFSSPSRITGVANSRNPLSTS